MDHPKSVMEIADGVRVGQMAVCLAGSQVDRSTLPRIAGEGVAAGKELAALIALYVGTHYVVDNIATYEKALIGAVTATTKEGRIIRTPASWRRADGPCSSSNFAALHST